MIPFSIYPEARKASEREVDGAKASNIIESTG
jgi:hypothetical protein